LESKVNDFSNNRVISNVSSVIGEEHNKQTIVNNTNNNISAFSLLLDDKLGSLMEHFDKKLDQRVKVLEEKFNLEILNKKTPILSPKSIKVQSEG